MRNHYLLKNAIEIYKIQYCWKQARLILRLHNYFSSCVRVRDDEERVLPVDQEIFSHLLALK